VRFRGCVIDVVTGSLSSSGPSSGASVGSSVGDAAGAGDGEGPVIAVVGGSGGVGASTLAAVLALSAPGSLLVDLDASGGGIDVLLGIEHTAGARWSGLQLDGGRLSPAALIEGLPRCGGTVVLAADTASLDPAAVDQVLGVAACAGPVVVDLPRPTSAVRAAALVHAWLVVVLARGDVPGLVAAHAVARSLPELPTALVVRRGRVAAVQAAELIGLPLLGELPASGGGALDPARLPRAAARIASGAWQGLGVAAVGSER
jgi:hypothetical protein